MTPTNNRKVVIWTLVCIFVLVLIFVLASFLTERSGIKITSSAVAISVIGAIAIGIERIIEAFWSFMAVLGKQKWPFCSAPEASLKLVNELNTHLVPFYEKAEQAIQKAEEAGEMAKEKLEQAKKLLTSFQENLQNLQSTGIVDAKMQDKAEFALQKMTALQDIFPKLENAADLGQQSLLAAMDFVSTFNENPGKRLVSIYAGMFVGVIVAGVTGLDLFQAVLEESTPALLSTGAHWGVGFTGLLVGLGASPTHEVISILKNLKEKQKAQNA